jgi:hypothetical protein
VETAPHGTTTDDRVISAQQLEIRSLIKHSDPNQMANVHNSQRHVTIRARRRTRPAKGPGTPPLPPSPPPPPPVSHVRRDGPRPHNPTRCTESLTTVHWPNRDPATRVSLPLYQLSALSVSQSTIAQCGGCQSPRSTAEERELHSRRPLVDHRRTVWPAIPRLVSSSCQSHPIPYVFHRLFFQCREQCFTSQRGSTADLRSIRRRRRGESSISMALSTKPTSGGDRQARETAHNTQRRRCFLQTRPALYWWGAAMGDGTRREPSGSLPRAASRQLSPACGRVLCQRTKSSAIFTAETFHGTTN